MNDAHRENVVGEFPDERSVRSAVRFLEHAGFDPDDVAVITGNARQARELSGSRSAQGAAIGLFVGLVLFAVFVAIGGPVMWSNPVALVLGVLGFAVAGLAIGALGGRGRLFVVDRAQRYEAAEDAGERLVSVSVAAAEGDRARRLLREAGAVRVREERTVETA